MIGVYKIENLINGKIYIGSSKDIEFRLKAHFYNLANNSHKNKHLQASYNKYTKSNFRSSIIELCEVGELISREQYYIDSSNWFYLYNKTRQAYGGGADTLSIEHVLLDLDGNVVDRFYSGRDLHRYFNSYCLPNTNTIFKKIYRVVTLQFFEECKDIIYSWKNYEETYTKT